MVATETSRGLVPSLEEIYQTGMSASSRIRDIHAKAQPVILKAWNDFYSNISVNDGRYYYSPKEAYEFITTTIKAIKYPSDIHQIIQTVTQGRGSVDHDWNDIAAFFDHDIIRLSPNVLFDFLRLYEVNPQHRKKIEMAQMHVTFLDHVARHFKNIADISALPYEFVAAVALLENGNPLPKEKFSPFELFQNAARFTVGRFYMDDYVIHDGSIEYSSPANNIVEIDIPRNLMLTINKPILFMVVDNLMKNAAAANSDAMDELGQEHQRVAKGLPFENSYSILVKLTETDDSIIFSVGDQGLGISLDNTLKRIHDVYELQRRKYKPRQILMSEWYQNIRRAIGDRQAKMLFSWPDNPFALRGLTAGSILDMQFVAGFLPGPWDLRCFASGTGLWGVYYLTNTLGGTIMGTNKFEGGALFSLELPKESVGLA